VDDPVNLSVYVKNVDRLVVKVFQINTRSYYRQNLREVADDINLVTLRFSLQTTLHGLHYCPFENVDNGSDASQDGLWPHHEFTFEYGAQSPFRRVRRQLSFDALRNSRSESVIREPLLIVFESDDTARMML